MAQADYNALVLTFGSVVNYWPLTDGAVTSFADSKGSATLTAATAPTAVTGPDGVATAAYINNVTNSVLTAASFSWPEDFSVAFWLNCDATMTGDLMAWEWNQSAFSKYVQHDMGVSGSNATQLVYLGSPAAAPAGWSIAKSSFGTATWKFVVATYKRSTATMTFYIDGSSAGSVNGTTAQNSGAPGTGYLGIGGRNNAGTRSLALDGAISGFALFNAVLSSSDVTALRSAMLSHTVPVSKATHGGGTAAKTRTANLRRPDRVVQAVGDSFVDAAGTNLSAHAPSGAGATGAWADDTAPSTDVLGIRSAGSGVLNDNSVSADNSNGFGVHNYVPASADYDVEIDFTLLSGETAGYDAAWALLRWSYPTEGLSVVATSSGVTIWRNAPSGASLGSGPGAVSAGAHTLRAKLRGNSITALLDSVEQIAARDTVGVAGPGKGGIRVGWASHTTEHAYITAYRLYDVYAVNGATGGGSTAKTFTRNPKAFPRTATGGGTTSKTFHRNTAWSKTTTLGLVPAGTGSVSQTGSPATITAGSGASDSLNYNSFPGLSSTPGLAVTGSRVYVTGAATTGHPFQGFPGFTITQAGTYLVNCQCTFGETSNPDYGTLIVRSTDRGATWSENLLTANGMGDCSMYQWPNGEIWAMGVNVNEYTAGGMENIYWKSVNDGVSWTGPFVLNAGTSPASSGGSYPYNGRYCVAATTPILHSNGTDTLFAIYRRNSTGTNYTDLDFYVEVRKLNQSDGTSSLVGVPFPYISGWRFEEPSLVYRPSDGALLCAARTAEGSPGGASMWMNVSHDDGASWGTPQRVYGTGGVAGPLTGTNFYVQGRTCMKVASNGVLAMVNRIGSQSSAASGDTVFATSADGFSWTYPVSIGGGAADIVNSGPGSSSSDRLSTYGALANDTDGKLVAVYGVEHNTSGVTGDIYMQKFAPVTNLVLAYHHANDHTSTTTGKLSVKLGASVSSMTEITGSPLRTVSGINLADVSNITLADGRVMIFWNESSTPGASNINTIVNFKWAISADGGHTFGSIGTAAVPGWATTVTAGSAGGAYAVAPCPPVQIPAGQPHAGDLLIATYGWDDRVALGGGGAWFSHEYVKLVRFAPDTPGTNTVVSTIFPDGAGSAYDETALLYLDDGTLMAACRAATLAFSQPVILGRRSTDNGATWNSISTLLAGTGTDGYGGRPSLIQTANGGVLIRFRYMNNSASSWSGYRLSSDRGVTFPGPDIDPYDGTTGRTGAVSGTGRGLDLYGAMSPTGPNTVALVWSEELGGTSAVLYGRELTVSGTFSVRSQTSARLVRASPWAIRCSGGGTTTTATLRATKTVRVSGGGITSKICVGRTSFAAASSGGGSTFAVVLNTFPLPIFCSGGGQTTKTFTPQGSVVFVLNVQMPDGTVVGAYRRHEWLGSIDARLNAGPGPVVQESVVADSTVRFYGLPAGQWVAYSSTFPKRRLYFFSGQP